MLKKLLLIAVIASFLSCDTNGPQQEECTPIDVPVEIVYPRGGETFSVGDTVTIKWKAVRAVANPVSIAVFTDSGKTHTMLVDTAVVVPDGDVACMKHEWIIGVNEVNPVDYSKGNAKIIIGKYNNEHDIGETTPYFTVKKKAQ